MDFIRLEGTFDEYSEADAYELYVNLYCIVAVQPEYRAVVTSGDGCTFFCTPESFERLLDVMREVG